MDSNAATPNLVVYADVADPWSFLASQRVDSLIAGGVAVEWRAVQARRRMPVKGLRLDAQTRPEAVRLLEQVRAHLGPEEWLPQAPPELVPRTEAAVSALAEARCADVSDAVRRRLFDAYWRDGLDVGDPEVLRTLLAGAFIRGHATSDPVRRFGYAVAMTRAPITTNAWRLVKQWHERWASLRQEALPVVVEGGRSTCGEAACAHLAELADPRRAGRAASTHAIARDLPMPTVSVQPPPTWVTQVGDPWQRESRLARA